MITHASCPHHIFFLPQDHETVTAHFQAKMGSAEELANQEKASLRRDIDDLTEKLEVT